MSRYEPVEIAAEIIHETDMAWLLSDGITEEWVPKSQVKDHEDGTFTMPYWLAEEKGFI
jgi:serine phosphatase RsbU (regulator of sigma subunit)